MSVSLKPEKFDLSEIEKSLQYSFQNPQLLTRAVTHASAQASGENYERLEFLGDRVLGLVIAEFLLKKFPQASEGELAKRFNQLVRMQTCAAVARDLNLGQWMIVGSSENDGDACQKPSILADACEAIIGAIYLDGGFETAAKVIRKCWEPYLSVDPKRLIDPKSALQEWAQGEGLALPEYSEAERDGPDHKPNFTVQVFIEGYPRADGKGRSKRSAEQTAAREFLLKNRIWTDDTEHRVKSQNDR